MNAFLTNGLELENYLFIFVIFNFCNEVILICPFFKLNFFMAAKANSLIPFPGCRSFYESEQSSFFGRIKQVDDLLLLLHKHKFIALTGQIGSGKSSFLQSGLIPALRKGHNGLAGKEWVICNTRPGLAPIKNLAYALSENNLLNPSVKSTPEQRLWIEKNLNEGISGLESVYRRSEIFGKKNLIIIIDQFEDLFLHTDRFNNAAVLNEETNQYINAITGANFAEDIAVYVVIALGAENIIDISPYRRLQDLMNQGQYLLPRINGQDLKRLIVNPLFGTNLSFSPESIDSLIAQFGSDMRLLPNLQFLLFKIWTTFQHTSDGEMVIQPEDLAEVGNLQYCFAVHLENHYDSLDTRQKLVFEKLFKAMLSEDSLGELTQPQTLTHLSSICEASTDEISLLLNNISEGESKFLDILPPDVSLLHGNSTNSYHRNSLVFLKNENIFIHWDRFRTWLDEEKESRDIYKRLITDQLRYDEGKTSLLRPPDLDFIWQWYQNTQPTKIWGEFLVPGYQNAIDYLTLSHSTYKNEMVLKENARKNEIKRYRRNMLIGVILALIILTVVSSLYLNAVEERKVAERAKANLDKEKKRIEKLNSSLQETKDSLSGTIVQRDKVVSELLNKEKTIKIQNVDLIRKGSELEKSANTINSQNQSLITKIKETEVAKSKAEVAKEKEIIATNKATDREKFSNIKNDLFALISEMAASENPLELITKLNAVVTNYNAFSLKVEGLVLPNNSLFKLLNLASRKLEVKNNISSQLIKSNAGLRCVVANSGGFICAGDEGKLFKNSQQNVSGIGQRVRTILPLKGENGTLLGTFDGAVYASYPGKSPVKVISSSSVKPIVSLLNSFQNGTYLLAGQNELTIFSLEKGVLSKSLLKDDLLAIYPMNGRGEFLISTRKGLYTLKPGEDVNLLLSIGKGEFAYPVSAIEMSENIVSLGFKNGKILLFPLNAFLQNPEIFPSQKFVYHSAEITKMELFKGKLFSASLDKSVQFVDLTLPIPNSFVVKLVENNSWIWDISIQQNKNGVDYLLCADENGSLKKYFITADDHLNYINDLAKRN
jgi:energy-coupling factor transporter ATP-binding protein EcfA2